MHPHRAIGHRASIAQRFTGPSGGRIGPTEGRDLALARRVAGRLWCWAPRRNPLLTSERKIAVRWVFVTETLMFDFKAPDDIDLSPCYWCRNVFTAGAHDRRRDHLYDG